MNNKYLGRLRLIRDSGLFDERGFEQETIIYAISVLEREEEYSHSAQFRRVELQQEKIKQLEQELAYYEEQANYWINQWGYAEDTISELRKKEPKSYDDFLGEYYNAKCKGCPEGHPSFWKTVIESPQWKAWTYTNPQYDIAECEELGILGKEHFQDFMEFSLPKKEDLSVEAVEKVMPPIQTLPDGYKPDDYDFTNQEVADMLNGLRDDCKKAIIAHFALPTTVREDKKDYFMGCKVVVDKNLPEGTWYLVNDKALNSLPKKGE